MATFQRRSGGPAPEAKCSPFLRAACLLSLTTVLVPWQLAAQAPPLDTATVRTLLVEAAEALDAVPQALVEAWFVDRLNELRASVDLPPIELPEPPELEPDPLDVLIEAREWDAVERYIVAMEPGEDQNVARRRLVRTFFPLFEALGDTASARSALDVMSPGQVFRVLMTRADALAGLGRWSEARRTALTALDVLTPMEVEGRRWPPHLGPALQLGLFDEIAARAIGLEDPRERALLLMALVADAAGLRVRPPLAL